MTTIDRFHSSDNTLSENAAYQLKSSMSKEVKKKTDCTYKWSSQLTQHASHGGLALSISPSTSTTNIQLHPEYFSLLILCLLALFLP